MDYFGVGGPSEMANVILSDPLNKPNNLQFCTDVSNNNLASVSYITPPLSVSEHPSFYGDQTQTVQAGMAYVQGLLNCLFANAPLYQKTLVFITWDDFGGFYDHVPPPQANDPNYAPNLTLGIRTPLLCIGPYCKSQVFKNQLDFTSELRCVEDVFGIAPFTALDYAATSACKADGSTMVDLNQTPIGPLAGLTTPPVLASPPVQPDVVDGVKWVLAKFRRERAREQEREEKGEPVLTARLCDPMAPLKSWAYYEPAGRLMEFCHSRDNTIVLWPGEVLGDDEATEDTRHSRTK